MSLPSPCLPFQKRTRINGPVLAVPGAVTIFFGNNKTWPPKCCIFSADILQAMMDGHVRITSCLFGAQLFSLNLKQKLRRRAPWYHFSKSRINPVSPKQNGLWWWGLILLWSFENGKGERWLPSNPLNCSWCCGGYIVFIMHITVKVNDISFANHHYFEKGPCMLWQLWPPTFSDFPCTLILFSECWRMHRVLNVMSYLKWWHEVRCRADKLYSEQMSILLLCSVISSELSWCT